MAAPCLEISPERLELLHGELGVSENAPQHFRVEDRAGVVGHGHAAACRVLVEPVASALSGKGRACPLQDTDDFSGGDTGQPRRHTATSRDGRATLSG